MVMKSGNLKMVLILSIGHKAFGEIHTSDLTVYMKALEKKRQTYPGGVPGNNQTEG